MCERLRVGKGESHLITNARRLETSLFKEQPVSDSLQPLAPRGVSLPMLLNHRIAFKFSMRRLLPRSIALAIW
jgi:hypothetical protein